MNQFISTILIFLWNLLHGAGRRMRTPRVSRTKAVSEPEDRLSLGTIIKSPFDIVQSGAEDPTDLYVNALLLLRHLILTGGTGAGKTSLLILIFEWLIKQKDTSVVLVDARGDLKDRLLVRLANNYSMDDLRDRLIVINFLDDQWSIGLNLLREPGLDPYTRVALILEVLGNLWDIGVQTLQVLRACLLTLALTADDYSLMECEPLLINPVFRKQLLASVNDPTLLRFWDRYDALSDQQRSQWVEPCLHRLSAWLSRPVLRNCFSQTSSLSLRKLLDERPDRILLISLGFDAMRGDAAVAGNLLVNLLLSAVMRTDKPESQRKPVYLVIDEFENLQESSREFQQAIQEGRRFKCGLVVSHQSSVQLEPKLLNLIRNVVCTQIFYQCGGGEAETLASQIAAEQPKAIIKNMLMNLQVGECVVVQRGASKPYVRVKTRFSPDPEVDKAVVEALTLQAFQRFGRPKAEIEAELAAREQRIRALIEPKQPAARSPRRSKQGQPPRVSTDQQAAGMEVRDLE